MKKKPNYEEAMKRLEEIVGSLENGDLPLEEAMKLFEEGTTLSAACYSEIKNAEQKISMISDLEKEETDK